MPELPEVETVARGVDRRVRGDRIVQVWFGSRPQSFKTPPARQSKGLAGRAILAVHRMGKHIVFELGAAAGIAGARHGQRETSPNPDKAAEAQWPTAQWIVHLGMTGRLLVTAPEAPVALHTHARLELASGCELRFQDPRRFGRLEFRDLGSGGIAFEAPGAEPLSIGAREFAELFQKRRLPIKAALLNQSLLAGVGNIYADESLFQAGLRPRRRTNRLTAAELERLRLALAPDSQRRHPPGRVVGLGLRGRRRRTGLLSTGALRLPAHRPALPPLPDADPAHRAGRARNPLLSQLSALRPSNSKTRRITVFGRNPAKSSRNP